MDEEVNTLPWASDSWTKNEDIRTKVTTAEMATIEVKPLILYSPQIFFSSKLVLIDFSNWLLLLIQFLASSGGNQREEEN